MILSSFTRAAVAFFLVSDPPGIVAWIAPAFSPLGFASSALMISSIATSTAEENKAAESRAKDAAAREAVVVPATGDIDDEIDLDDVDVDFDADEIIAE